MLPRDSALGRSHASRRRLAAAAIAYLVLIALLSWAGGEWAERRAAGEAIAQARSDAAARASLLVSELQKYRLIPVVLGEYPDVRAALDARSMSAGAAGAAGAAAARLDAKLEQLAASIGSSAIYLIDADGRTVAASNARSPTSFVGRNYRFRPYFSVARARGAAEFFGLGTVSGQPGLYLSRRVGSAPRDGVIVVKFGFDAVEAGWRSRTEPAFVTDRNGVILVTNRPEWRFRLTRDLPAAGLVEMAQSRQFGTASLKRLDLAALDPDRVSLPRRGGPAEIFAIGRVGVPVAGWTLAALEPIRPVRAGWLATARLVTLAAATLLMLPLFAWLRARDRSDMAAAARLELEEQVVARTAALERAQTRFREAREALAHANRLGSIGQITAAVAHEVNQPAAAIRSFAENGAELLRRGDQAGASENLAMIAELTGRIGAITAELRTYARRGSGGVRPTPLSAAVDGALVFTAHRLRAMGLTVDRHGEAGVAVMADPIRLEQILVNLLHNALDAVGGAPAPRIGITVDRDGATVAIVVRDNGAGIDASVGDRLFTPFATSKPSGLGLGLGIARDIAREFGGELDTLAVPPPWTTGFVLGLQAA